MLSLIGSLFMLKDGVNINNSLDIWFVKNDSIYENYIDFRDRYSTDEVVVIYVRSGNIFTTDAIEKMVSMCSQIDSLSSVKNVFYLANAPYIKNSFLGPVVTPLMGSLPKTDEELIALKSKIETIPHYRKILIDKDLTGFMAYVTLYPRGSQNFNPNAIREIKRIAFLHFENAHFGGIPVINQSLNETANIESKSLSALSLLIVVTFLLISLRSWQYVIISVLSVIIPITWLFGVYTYFGGNFNMITIVIPTILLITGTATSIHIVNICHRFYVEDSISTRNALIKGLRYVFWPSFFTATTTMAGFISLAVSPIDGIKEVGILSAVGVGLVFICSFLVTSVAFLFFPPHKSKHAQSKYLSTKTPAILEIFKRINTKRPRLALTLFIAIIVVAIPFLWQIEVGTNTFDYLDKSSAAYTDNFTIEQSVGPFMPVEMLISRDSTFNASELHKIFEFQNSLSGSGVVENIFSPIDIMAYMNQAINNQNEHKLPKGIGLTEWLKQLYLKNRRNNFQKYENKNFSEIRISANTLVGSSKEYDEKQKIIRKIFNETFGNESNISLSIRGYLPMYVAMNNHIITGQIKTFSIAFILILALIVVCFKSFRIALMALIPNLFPISLVILSMWLLNIPIDQSTALITCVILGISFDDSIHLIYAFRRYQEQGLSKSLSTEKALETTASAMISTSVALFAGFVVIATTSSTSLLYFGILCSIAVFGSLLGNIWLLPILLNKGK